MSRLASVQMSADRHYVQTAGELHVQAVLVPRDSVSMANCKAHCQLWALQSKGEALRLREHKDTFIIDV